MSKPKIILTSLTRFLLLLSFGIVVMIGIPVAGMANIEMRKTLGLRTVAVPVVGTGSMYPSLFWSSAEGGPEDESKKVVEEYRTTPHLYRRFEGLNLLGHIFFHRTVGYGDMVAFKNDKTTGILKSDNKDTSAGFIKRVIGVPGDIVELRDGFVYKNNELISEPYISSPRSTYGGSGIKDCTKIYIPDSSYLVLGDNRKVSSDSRFELGLIKENDIEFVLPFSEQKIYHSLWRDTTQDDKLLGQPSLSGVEFVKLVNIERAKKGISGLSLKPTLVKSASLRGQNLLKDPKTNYDMKTAIANAGYSNIILGEFISYGHFTSKELLENLLFNGSTAKQIMNKDYSDIGVTEVNLNINGCPSQIIIGHLGGYIPASYDNTTVVSWTKLRDNLRTILPSWESAVGNVAVDQVKLGEVLVVMRRRLALAEEIIATMEKKDWLSDSQQTRIKTDDVDAKSAETLSKELNKE